jgi:hypothetical protein
MGPVTIKIISFNTSTVSSLQKLSKVVYAMVKQYKNSYFIFFLNKIYTVMVAKL